MDFILYDLSESALADANHENFRSFFRLMCRYTPGFEWIESSAVTLVVCDAPTSGFNRVVRTRLLPTEVDSKIKEVVDFYSSKGLPFLWMVGPSDSPTDLSRYLEQSGFVRSESPGMAMDLNQLNAPVSPSGLRVEKVQNRESLETYSTLMPKAFEFNTITQAAVTRWVRSIGVHENLRHYLGYLNGTSVATSSVFLDNGVAGLYCVGTMPEARGKGIGSVMSAVPLLEAREEGYRASILQSSKMGYGLYLRLGFKDCTKIVSYSLKK